MRKVFICYSRESEDIVSRLAADIEALGYEPWFDRELSGGQVWWDQILARIRETDLVAVAVSPASVDSVACRREYTYAAQLGKPILPVLVADGVRENLLPESLSTIQYVDVRKLDREAVLQLARALTSLPPAGPPPDPLPDPPGVPVSYLGGLRERITTDEALGLSEQSTLLVELKRAIRDPDTRADGLTLVERFTKRPDLLASIARELDDLGVRETPRDSAERPAIQQKGREQGDTQTPVGPAAGWKGRLTAAGWGAMLGAGVGIIGTSLAMLSQGVWGGVYMMEPVTISAAAGAVSGSIVGRDKARARVVVVCGVAGYVIAGVAGIVRGHPFIRWGHAASGWGAALGFVAGAVLAVVRDRLRRRKSRE